MLLERRSSPRTALSLLVLFTVFLAVFALAAQVLRFFAWDDFTTGAQTSLLSLAVAQMAESRFKSYWRERAQRKARSDLE